MITIGSADKKNAIERKVGLNVSAPIHVIMTKRVTEEPNNEINCPIQKKI